LNQSSEHILKYKKECKGGYSSGVHAPLIWFGINLFGFHVHLCNDDKQGKIEEIREKEKTSPASHRPQRISHEVTGE
jgi:alpha-acetolactate decarboxylase